MRRTGSRFHHQVNLLAVGHTICDVTEASRDLLFLLFKLCTALFDNSTETPVGTGILPLKDHLTFATFPFTITVDT